MKLYILTEEQVQETYNRGHMDGRLSNIDYSITDYLTPIELPSDEEIENASKKWVLGSQVWEKGAKWMKEQILNQNK